MKNKKFMKETPVIETKPIRGSVGEFIELLKDFDPAAKFELNGAANINFDLEGQPVTTTIKPISNDNAELIEDDFFFDECNCCKDKSSEDFIMDAYLFGAAEQDPEFVRMVRHNNGDFLTEAPVMMPNKEQLSYEANNLFPIQNLTIQDIRNHNAMITELMAEMHRREIAALLEYNTQCLANFGAASNKEMCRIVDDII